MIYVILALIVIVSIALWRSSKQQKQQAEPTNRFKPKAKTKRASMKKAKVSKAQRAQTNSPQPRGYRTQAINLHHPAHQSDDIAMTDQALGLNETPKQQVINQNALVILYLVASEEQPYVGFSLLQNLLSTGLVLNADGVFERQVQTNHGQQVLFQVASMKKPGTFPQEHIDHYETSGLVFYMEPGHQVEHFKQIFEMMTSQMALLQSRIGGHIFTPEKTLLEAHDFRRYADYLVSLDETVENV